MNKRFFTLVSGFLAFFLVFGSCSFVPGNESKDDENPEIISIMIWNIENLFDVVDDGTEYDEYLTTNGWNDKKYEARLLSISQAIESAFSRDYSENSYDINPPALIGLVEVENLGVLGDLASSPALAKYGYKWAYFGKLPGMALSAGVISRFPLSNTKVHSITNSGETIPRPVIEFHLELGDESIVFFLCHWKSKLGGDDATESLRRASAKVINRRTSELHTEEPEKAIIVMGDLNENHDEFYRHSGEIISALLPDDPWAAKLAAEKEISDFLILSGEKPPASKYFSPENFNNNLPVFYSPWGNELEDGSYYYKKDWETIDHFLLSEGLFNNKGWVFEDCRVLAREPFTGKSGFPVAYSPRNGSGLSDHLPLLLFLKQIKPEPEDD